MHPPRIPIDFASQYRGYGKWHLTDQDTGIFWFGVVFVLGASWNLYTGFRDDEFLSRWPLPPADREHPVMFWSAAVGNTIVVLAGLDFMISGLVGINPFSLG
jgi:hypothetical protein